MRRMRVLGAFLVSIALSLGAAAQPAGGRKAFPDFERIDGRGGVQSLKSTLGRATVVNFWATWCGPCRLELPELQELYDELGGRGVAVVTIAVDSPRQHVPLFMKRLNLSLPVYFLEPEAETALAIPSIPTTVLLDEAGKVVEVFVGYSKESMRQLRDQAEGLVAQPRGQGGS